MGTYFWKITPEEMGTGFELPAGSISLSNSNLSTLPRARSRHIASNLC